MLARLERIPGILAVHSDPAGSHLVLTAADDAAIDAATAALAERFVAVLTGEEADAQLASRDSGEPWFAADQLLELSLLEARVLAHRIAAAVGLEGPRSRRLVETSRRVLAARFTEVHAEGGRPSPGWFFAEWPALADAIVAACAGWLEPAACREVARILGPLFVRS